jgi:hypothetical protein
MTSMVIRAPRKLSIAARCRSGRLTTGARYASSREQPLARVNIKIPAQQISILCDWLEIGALKPEPAEVQAATVETHLLQSFIMFVT